MRRYWLIGLVGCAACSRPNPYSESADGSTSTPVLETLTGASTLGGTAGATLHLETTSGTSGAVQITTQGPSGSESAGHESASESTDGQGDSATEGAFTSDDASTSSGGSAAEESTSGGALGCSEETHLCLPPPPEEWLGPVAAWFGPVNESPGGCPFQGWSTSVSRSSELAGTGTTCTCQCTASGVSNCTEYGGFGGTDIWFFTNEEDQTTCAPLPRTYVRPEIQTTCTNFNAITLAAMEPSIPSYWVAGAFPPVSGGRCNMVAASEFEEPYFTHRFLGCSPGPDHELGRCEDGASLCVPKLTNLFNEGMCVYRSVSDAEPPGPEICPEGYPNFRLTYSSWEDTRACSTCSCRTEQPEGYCEGHLELYRQPCAGDVGQGFAYRLTPQGTNMVCNPPPFEGPLVAARWFPTSIRATCRSSGGSRSGEVNPMGATAVCCTTGTPPEDVDTGTSG